jgi:hypothetical protein
MFGTEALDKGLTKIFEALTWMFDRNDPIQGILANFLAFPYGQLTRL